METKKETVCAGTEKLIKKVQVYLSKRENGTTAHKLRGKSK